MVDVPEPDAPGANEALLDIEIATLNKHDLLFIGNALGGGPALPTIVGNEGFGRVLAIGRGVENDKVGDRVLAPVLSQTWREKMIVPASSLFPLPDGDPHQFSMLSGGVATATLVQALSSGGVLVACAAASGEPMSVNALQLIFKQLQVQGFFLGYFDYEKKVFCRRCARQLLWWRPVRYTCP